MRKITVIMPTFNDAESIRTSLLSLFGQTYEDWELLIVDDGSTDDTGAVVKEMRSSHPEFSERITYIYQDNQDQLSAISNALPQVTGDYIYILHSDDEIPERDTFLKLADLIEEDDSYEAYIGNWEIMNEHGDVTGIKKVMKYKESLHRVALLYLWLGRNLYVDVGLFKTSAFKSSIKESYLTWNMPFWIDFEKKGRLLRVKHVDFIMYRYRVFSGNYINNELGQLNVFNGELRTLTSIMEWFYVPGYKLQFWVYRLMNKLGIGERFRPRFKKQPEKNKGPIVLFAVRKRFGSSYKENLYLRSVVSYYEKPSSRRIVLDEMPEDCPVYEGKDMRKFHQALLEGTLHSFYINLMMEMEEGFYEIQCSEVDFVKVEKICRFLCIHPRIHAAPLLSEEPTDMTKKTRV